MVVPMSTVAIWVGRAAPSVPFAALSNSTTGHSSRYALSTSPCLGAMLCARPFPAPSLT